MTQQTLPVPGTVDLDAAAELAARLTNAILCSDDDIVVDCSRKPLDAAAVRVLAEAAALLEAEGRKLHVQA